MKALLIHNHVTNDFVKKSLEQDDFTEINFKVQTADFSGDFSFDAHLDSYYEKIENSQFDVIYIFTQMSEFNYIEFEGLRIAHHIRLTPKWKNQDTPIILIGNETKDELCAITQNFNILYTPGVYLASDCDEESITEQCNLMKSHFRTNQANRLNKNDQKQYLERTDIQPPGHYDSKHSVDNELALIRWSRSIGLKLHELEKEFGTSLYFKCLNQKNPVPPPNSEQYKISIEGTVLLIDDKYKTGWQEFYKTLLGEHTLHTLSIEKQSDGQEEIIDKAKTKIENNKDNLRVVLLDMRLCDLDFASKLKQCEYEFEGLKDELTELNAKSHPSESENERINEIKEEILKLKDEILELEKQTKAGTPSKTDIARLTGVKILRWINENYPYIQVIVTTASAKAETFNVTKNSYAYIQKTIERDIPSSIEHIKTSIESAVPISKQLHQHWENFNKIKSYLHHFTTYHPNLEVPISKAMDQNVRVSLDLIKLSYYEGNEIFTTYAYHQLFLIIEHYVKDETVYKTNRNHENYVIKPDPNNNQETTRYLVCKPYEITLDNDQTKTLFRRALDQWGNTRIIESNFDLKNNYTLNFKIREILLFRFPLNNANQKPWGNYKWWDLNNIRNKVSHDGIPFEHTAINELSKFIIYILDPNNIDTTDRQNEALEL